MNETTEDRTRLTLLKVLKQLPPKERLEIMMHIQMAESQSNSSLNLSKALQELISKK